MVRAGEFWDSESNSVRLRQLARTIGGGLVLNLVAGIMAVILNISTVINNHITLFYRWLGGIVSSVVSGAIGPFITGVYSFINLIVVPLGPFGILGSVAFVRGIAWLVSIALWRFTDG
jgi:hypothetical protein